MSTVSEPIVIEGIDLGAPIPCEVYPQETRERICGRPSVARVKFTCEPCGYETRMFTCQECLEVIKIKGFTHVQCERVWHTWVMS